jgi:hypothetical protein
MEDFLLIPILLVPSGVDCDRCCAGMRAGAWRLERGPRRADRRRREMRSEKVVAMLAMLRKNQGFLEGKGS